MHRLLALLLLLPPRAADASHCYGYTSCTQCQANARGADCAWCGTSCQMATDACAATPLIAQGAGASACPGYVAPPGGDFFEAAAAGTFATNPTQLNYGVAVTDVDGDDTFEALVAGFGVANQLFRWDANAGAAGQLVDVAAANGLQDASRKAIGVAACDTDGDGVEEIYVLNTDAYSGETQTSDRLYRKGGADNAAAFVDILGGANTVAGRSCACVDRDGDHKYEIMVANYGGPMRLYAVDADTLTVNDVAPAAGVDRTTGGRALVAGPIVTNRYDIFANNEGPSSRRMRRNLLSHRSNYLFRNSCPAVDGEDVETEATFEEIAGPAGIKDADYTGRGTAFVDSNRDGLLDIVYGNWQGAHRLFVQQPAADADPGATPTFADQATTAMADPSPIRTVIVADFDNDGYEEIFYNNIPGDNRLFQKIDGIDDDWTQINIGAALEPSGHGTGAAVLDFDGDGVLELLVSHGESSAEPLSLYRANDAVTGVRGNAWLRVLPKTRGGAPARGATVMLHDGPGSQLRVIDSGSGYLCQMEPVAHYGLGADGNASATWTVTITWPDGVRVTRTGIAKNQMHVVAYPTAGETVQRVGCQRGAAVSTCTIGSAGIPEGCTAGASDDANQASETDSSSADAGVNVDDESSPTTGVEGEDEQGDSSSSDSSSNDSSSSDSSGADLTGSTTNRSSSSNVHCVSQIVIGAMLAMGAQALI